MPLTKKSKKNKVWTLTDNNFAWDEYTKGKSHKWIAKKLGRTEKAVEINLSKMRKRLKSNMILSNYNPGTPTAPAAPLRKPKTVTFTVIDMVVAVVGGGALGAIIAGLTL